MRAMGIDRRIEAAGPIVGWWRTGMPSHQVPRDTTDPLTVVWWIRGYLPDTGTVPRGRLLGFGTEVSGDSWHIGLIQFTTLIRFGRGMLGGLVTNAGLVGSGVTDSPGFLTFGQSHNGTNPWPAGYPAAVAVYDHPLTGPEISRVHDWMRATL